MKVPWVNVASVIALGLASLVGMPSLSATPLPGSLQLRLSTPAGSVTLTDQGGCTAVGIGNCGAFTNDASGDEGILLTTGFFSVWTVTVSTSFGSPNSSQGMIELASTILTATPAAGTLTVQLTQTGFDLNVAQFNLSASGVIMGTGSSVTIFGSGANNNIAFSTSNNLVAGDTFGPVAFSHDEDGVVGNSVNPYSLTVTQQITAGTGTTSFSGDAIL